MADFDRINPGPVEDLVGIVDQIDHLFGGSGVDAGQAADALQKLAVGFGEIGGPTAASRRCNRRSGPKDSAGARTSTRSARKASFGTAAGLSSSPVYSLNLAWKANSAENPQHKRTASIAMRKRMSFVCRSE